MRGLKVVAAAVLALAPFGARAQSDIAGVLTLDAPSKEQIQAEQKACEQKKPPRKANGTISEGTYRRMERIIEQIAKGQYAESEQKLIELSQSAHGDYEKAIILQTLGFAYASDKKEELGMKAFEDALATNALPQQVHEQMMFNVAQLYLAADKYDKAIEALNKYLAETCNPLPDAHVLLASVYAEKKKWREMLKQVDLAIVKAATPKEQWLQLKLAGHYEMKELPKCAEVLLALVALAPQKEDYWKQLSGILFEVKKDQEALAVLGLADRRGYLSKENEYKNLSNMYMFMQIPYKAANVLQRGLEAKVVEPNEKTYESLSNAWLMSREYGKAEEAMKKAASLSDKGELYKRLGQIQMESENWKAALESLQKAASKGTKEPGETALFAGICAIQLRQWKTADAQLHIALQHEKTTKQATEWLNNMQQEVAYAEKTGQKADDTQPEAPAAEPADKKKDAVKAPAETKKN